MEKIVDTIFTKQSVVRTNDPYSLALAIKEIASHYGIIKEKVHEYDTNGPRKVVKLYFDIKNPINKHTTANLSFIMKGEIGIATSFLQMKVVGKSKTTMSAGTGFVSQVYGEYYLKHIFPLLRKESERRLREISTMIEHDVKSTLHNHA